MTYAKVLRLALLLALALPRPILAKKTASERKQMREALRLFKAAVVLRGPGGKVARQDESKRDKAREMLRSAVRLHPSAARFQMTLGLELRNGPTDADMEDAAAAFTAVTALKPKHDSAWNEAGVLLRLLGRPEAALANFERQLEVVPKDTGGSGISAWYGVGLSLLELERTQDAVEVLADALEVDPKHPLAEQAGKVLQAHVDVDEDEDEVEDADADADDVDVDVESGAGANVEEEAAEPEEEKPEEVAPAKVEVKPEAVGDEHVAVAEAEPIQEQEQEQEQEQASGGDPETEAAAAAAAPELDDAASKEAGAGTSETSLDAPPADDVAATAGDNGACAAPTTPVSVSALDAVKNPPTPHVAVFTAGHKQGSMMILGIVANVMRTIGVLMDKDKGSSGRAAEYVTPLRGSAAKLAASAPPLPLRVCKMPLDAATFPGEHPMGMWRWALSDGFVVNKICRRRKIACRAALQPCAEFSATDASSGGSSSSSSSSGSKDVVERAAGAPVVLASDLYGVDYDAFVDFWRQQRTGKEEEEGRGAFDFTILRAVRDPRDVVVSGWRYHREGKANEPWMHRTGQQWRRMLQDAKAKAATKARRLKVKMKKKKKKKKKKSSSAVDDTLVEGTSRDPLQVTEFFAKLLKPRESYAKHLKSLSPEDGLSLEIRIAAKTWLGAALSFARAVEAGPEALRGRVVFVKYEDVWQDPAAAVTRMGRLLFPRDAWLADIFTRSGLQELHLKWRQAGIHGYGEDEDSAESRTRKMMKKARMTVAGHMEGGGQPGKWRSAMSEANMRVFQEEGLGDLVRLLGYEQE